MTFTEALRQARLELPDRSNHDKGFEIASRYAELVCEDHSEFSEICDAILCEITDILD